MLKRMMHQISLLFLCIICVIRSGAQNTFPSGNIGIGISAVDKLHVNGNIISEGSFYSGNPDNLRIYAGHPLTTSGNLLSYLVFSAGGGHTFVGTPAGWGGSLNLVTAGYTRMAINSAGNVTIGSPGTVYAKLQVENTTDNAALFNGLVNGNGRFSLGTDASANVYFRSANNVDLRLGVNTDQLTIKYGGNIGIGMTAPTQMLEVNGVGFFTGSSPNATSSASGTYIANGGIYSFTNGNNANDLTIRGKVLTFYSGDTYGERMRINTAGNVAIGTTDPGTYRLAVNGNIRAKKVVVETNWADYVFDGAYKLRSLTALESFIKENKHLPDVPTAKEVKENGVSLGENQVLLLKKIEELTLYLIESGKDIKALQEQLEKQGQELYALKEKLKR